MTEAMLEKVRTALEEGEKTPLVDYSLERVLERIDQAKGSNSIVEPNGNEPPTS